MRGLLVSYRRRPAPAGPRLASLVDALTGIAHLVTDDEMSARVRTGRFRAICDEDVLVGSLLAPATRSCNDCLHRRPQLTEKQ